MITRAIVEAVSSSNPRKFKVRIPIFDNIATAREHTGFKDLSEASACTLPNADDVIAVGDSVFVGFEDNDLGRPVVLGHIYNGVDDKALIKIMAEDITTNNLHINKACTLPVGSGIGDITYDDLLALKKLLE